jgi:hypothetical protein
MLNSTARLPSQTALSHCSVSHGWEVFLGMRLKCKASFHGCVKTLGSSIVASYSRTLGDENVQRSTRCIAVPWMAPTSSQPHLTPR